MALPGLTLKQPGFETWKSIEQSLVPAASEQKVAQTLIALTAFAPARKAMRAAAVNFIALLVTVRMQREEGNGARALL